MSRSIFVRYRSRTMTNVNSFSLKVIRNFWSYLPISHSVSWLNWNSSIAFSISRNGLWGEEKNGTSESSFLQNFHSKQLTSITSMCLLHKQYFSKWPLNERGNAQRFLKNNNSIVNNKWSIGLPDNMERCSGLVLSLFIKITFREKIQDGWDSNW